MRQSTVRKSLYNLIGPIFIETLLIMLLGAMDTFMLSQYSDDKVASVGVVNQLLNMVFLVFGVTTIGTSVLCSQYLGAGQKKSVIQVVGISLLVNTLIGGITSFILFFKGESLLALMDLNIELMPDALVYMQLVGGFAFLQAISLTLSAILRSANKAYYPMRVTLFINILNIIGNYALIFGKFGLPELGVQGAAISTTISRSVAMLLLFGIVFGKEIKEFPLRYFRPFPFDKLKNLLTVGLPAAGEQLSYSLSQVVITYFTIMLGKESLTARTYVMNIVMFSYVFAIAIGQGGAIYIGHLIGKQKRNAAFIVGRYCVKVSLVISLAIAILTAVMGRSIMELLTSNPEIIRLGVILLIIDILLEVGRAINIFAVNCLLATGDALYPCTIGVIFMWGIATAMGYVFGVTWGWGIIGMWIAFTLDENVRAFFFVKRWYSKKWEKKGFVRIASPTQHTKAA